MLILHRGKITYYIKNEAVIVGINDFQFLSYSVYALQNRTPFYEFKRTLENSQSHELATASEVLRLGRKHRLKGFATARPTIPDVEETS